MAKLSQREREWMERDVSHLRIGFDERRAQRFADARIGTLFRYSSPIPEWGAKGYAQFAIGPKGSTAKEVRALLDQQYGGDDWRWKIVRYPNSSSRRGAVDSSGSVLRGALRRDR